MARRKKKHIKLASPAKKAKPWVPPRLRSPKLGHNATISIGGVHVTATLAPEQKAEAIKRRLGLL